MTDGWTYRIAVAYRTCTAASYGKTTRNWLMDRLHGLDGILLSRKLQRKWFLLSCNDVSVGVTGPRESRIWPLIFGRSEESAARNYFPASPRLFNNVAGVFVLRVRSFVSPAF